MALKAQRLVIEADPLLTCDTATERGVVLVLDTSGSGIALGDSRNSLTLAATASGTIPMGILLNDVVSVDTTRYHLNFQKDETLVDNPCTILRKGYVTTNKVTGTPAVGDIAYLTANGVVTPTLSTTGGLAATPKVGKFMSTKDADGYAKVEVNFPMV